MVNGRMSRIEEKVLAGVGLEQDEIEDVFGESDSIRAHAVISNGRMLSWQ